jgi:DNA-directed RNA polymerase specialized sigma24 family protein
LALERDQSSPSDDSDLTGLSWGLERLDESEQHLLILVYWERLTYRQIAFVLDISENAVGIRINRVKKKLKGIIDASSGVVVEDSPAVEEDEQ